MPVQHWAAPPDVLDLLSEVLEKHPHLSEATFAVSFADSKPFIGDRINLGKVSKFSKADKLWHAQDKKYDFRITLCAEVWAMLSNAQRKAHLDLRVSQCKVEYEPETIEENGKKIKVKDEWGRVSYTTEIRRDDEGHPMWKIVPADILILTENIRRCGLWYEELEVLKEAVGNV
jgi:hypothetical protein